MTPLVLVLLEVMRLAFVGAVAAYVTNRLNAHFNFERFRREEVSRQCHCSAFRSAFSLHGDHP